MLPFKISLLPRGSVLLLEGLPLKREPMKIGSSPHYSSGVTGVPEEELCMTSLVYFSGRLIHPEFDWLMLSKIWGGGGHSKERSFCLHPAFLFHIYTSAAIDPPPPPAPIGSPPTRGMFDIHWIGFLHVEKQRNRLKGLEFLLGKILTSSDDRKTHLYPFQQKKNNLTETLNTCFRFFFSLSLQPQWLMTHF